MLSVLKSAVLSLLLTISFFLATAQTEYTVTVDPTNGNITKIDSIPGLMWLTSSLAFDQTTKRGTIVGRWDTLPTRLFTVNAATGATIANPLLPVPRILILEYSRSTGILYTITYDNTTGSCYLATVDPSNASYTIINDIPGLSGVSDAPVIDEANQHMLMNTGWGLLTIDLATGNTIASTT